MVTVDDRVEVDEAVEKLQKSFRLTQYEARLYLAILRGARSPKEASSMSGVPLPRIYDVVRVLEAKGFVVPTEEGWYRAVPPRAVAVSEIARIEEEARRRTREVMDTASSIEALARRWKEEESVSVEGLYSILSTAAEIIDEAGHGIIILSHVFVTHANAVSGLVRAARSRGRSVKVAMSAGVKPERLPEDLRDAVRLGAWAPDMAVSPVGVVIVVPSPRGEARGLLVRSRDYASLVIEGIKASLGT